MAPSYPNLKDKEKYAATHIWWQISKEKKSVDWVCFCVVDTQKQTSVLERNTTTNKCYWKKHKNKQVFLKETQKQPQSMLLRPVSNPGIALLYLQNSWRDVLRRLFALGHSVDVRGSSYIFSPMDHLHVILYYQLRAYDWLTFASVHAWLLR